MAERIYCGDNPDPYCVGGGNDVSGFASPMMAAVIGLSLALALAMSLLAVAVWVNGTLVGEKETWRKAAIYECWRSYDAHKKSR